LSAIALSLSKGRRRVRGKLFPRPSAFLYPKFSLCALCVLCG